MSFRRENLQFAGNSFVGHALNDPSFYDLPIQEQAKAVGWAVGCPVVEELTNPQNPNPGRGPEAMLPRYGTVAFWGGYINRAAQERNPSLYTQLTQNVQRLPGEPVGKHEPQSVPETYIDVIPPTETLVGFSLPRLLIKQIGGDELSPEDRQAHLVQGLEAIEGSIDAASTPEQLLALSAERIAQADVDPVTTLGTILSVGWYDENNADSIVDAFKNALEANAPVLWQVYSGLSDQQKSERGIL